MEIKENVKTFWNRNKKIVKRVGITTLGVIGAYGAYRFGCQHGINTLQRYMIDHVPEAFDMVSNQYDIDIKKK